MEVIPLTLAISLLLSLTFITLFLIEFSRPQRAGATRDSLLPLEPDSPRHRGALVSAEPNPELTSAHGDSCPNQGADGKCCATCQRRKDRAQAAPVSVRADY